MDYELKKILIILVGVTIFGGITGLFNVIYGTILFAFLVGYIAITLFWKDLLIILARFISSFIIPKRWRH